jgi:hypothetical protein
MREKSRKGLRNGKNFFASRLKSYGQEVIRNEIKESSADTGSGNRIAGEVSQDDTGNFDYRSGSSPSRRI